MKILMVGKFPLDAKLFKDGTEGSVYGEAKTLVEKGHKVIVLDMPRSIIDKDYHETVDGIEVYRFFCAEDSLKQQKKVIRKRLIPLMLSCDPSICHLHVTQHHSLQVVSALRRHKIKYLVEIHGLPRKEAKQAFRKQKTLPKLFAWWYECFREFVFVRNTHLVVTDTDYEKQALRKFAFRHKLDIHVIHQGIHDDFYQQDYHPQDNTLLAVGTIAPRKDQLMMLDVVDKLRKDIPDIKLSIVGGLVDLDYYKKLQTRIVRKDLVRHVSLHPDVHAIELLKQYSRSRLFMLCASEESQCVAMAEAMAVGLPVVSTKVGGIKHLLSEGDNGFLCAHGDVKAMVKHIKNLLQHPDLCQQMSERNKKDAEKYRWSSIVEKYIKLYAKAMKDK